MGFNTHAKAGSKLTEQTAPTVMLYLLLHNILHTEYLNTRVIYYLFGSLWA